MNTYRTEIQTDIAIFIGDFVRHYREVPAVSDLIREFGLLKTLSVYGYLAGLMSAGMIRPFGFSRSGIPVLAKNR
ncbi:hypothetical protein [Bilifractor porci]|uniref:LexA repressor DNA-binding domain-containing protein n=1 Tax=Bilifractor porci TaxID=2606636 RepID=A0A7X2P6X8_9FIRM|nr:hypothetical protein [Bilifractor porci]MST81334.1 hypothetical protein [Bilifractor porci]